MTYFAFPGGWGTYNLNGAAEKSLVALGAHGYATQALAEAHVNASPNPLIEIQLQADKASSLSPLGSGSVGVESTPATGTLPSLSNPTQFLSILAGKNVWIRVGEFVIGAALIIVGLAHIMGDGSTAMKIAKKAALV